MISLVVFYLHVVALATVFTKRYQEESVGEGFLAILFMALIFFVGWAMASFVTKLVMPPEGWAIWFDRDAASLLLLTAAEAVLYYFYFGEESGSEHSGELPRP